MSGARLEAAADHLDADQLDRLLDPGAVAVGALVLGAERLFERRQRRAVEASRRQWHPQLERLPLVVQAGAAPDLDPTGAEPVLAEPRPRVGFERLYRRLQRLRRGRAQQALPGAREIVFHLGIEQAERREDPGRRRN